jgi:hypothetical protein
VALGRLAIEIFEPFATELSVIARPSAVAIAICAEVSVESGAVSGLSRISTIEGN